METSNEDKLNEIEFILSASNDYFLDILAREVNDVNRTISEVISTIRKEILEVIHR